MPFPRDRLDLYCCKTEIENELQTEAFERLINIWKSAGFINVHNSSKNNHLIEGGFTRIWHDSPKKVVLYSNNQGGFRVLCRLCHKPLASEFSKALTMWRRQEGPRRLMCAHCMSEQNLEEMDCRPPIQFANGAIVFSGVNHTELTTQASFDLKSVIGDFKVIMSRKS